MVKFPEDVVESEEFSFLWEDNSDLQSMARETYSNDVRQGASELKEPAGVPGPMVDGGDGYFYGVADWTDRVNGQPRNGVRL